MTTQVNMLWNENIMDLDGQRERLVTVTTEHPASSHGTPVVIVDGQAMGPSDLPAFATLEFPKDANGHTVHVELRERASRAGFRVI